MDEVGVSLVLVVFWLFLCFMVVLMAVKKGRSGVGFFFLSLFLSPLVGFIAVMVSKSDEQIASERGEYGEYKKCPFCAEAVKREAITCRYCNRDLPATTKIIPDGEAGLCQKCNARIRRDATACPKCSVQFGPPSRWHVMPVTVMPSPAPAAAPATVAPATKKCPYCAEEVRVEAIKCKHCGSEIKELSAPTQGVRSGRR